MTIQFNVLDASILREAQLAPERYRNLQVRVAGWNALWNDISKKEQDAYILRAENIRYKKEELCSSFLRAALLHTENML